jgi:hypothetical protein
VWYLYETSKANKKKRLNETYGRVREDKHLSGMFPIMNVLEKVDTLLPLLFNFALVYNSRAQKTEFLKLNGFHQLLIYANDINMLGKSIHTVKKNIDFFSH